MEVARRPSHDTRTSYQAAEDQIDRSRTAYLYRGTRLSCTACRLRKTERTLRLMIVQAGRPT